MFSFLKKSKNIVPVLIATKENYMILRTWGRRVRKKIIFMKKQVTAGIALKFGLSEKHTKFEKNRPHVQSMRKIAQIFVCFSESPNFTAKNKERHFSWYVFLSSMLSKSVPYSIPFYQRKSLDKKTFPEKHGLSITTVTL